MTDPPEQPLAGGFTNRVVRAGGTVRRSAGPWTPREVICHHDFAPYNCVLQGGRFTGLIDFDLCAPGPRLSDLAYTAYRFVPLQPPRAATVDDGASERSPFELTELHARLSAFLERYAAGDPERRYSSALVVRAATQRLEGIADWTEQHFRATRIPDLEHHAHMYRAHARWLETLPLA